VGALFLAMEARGELEVGTSVPLGKPRKLVPPYSDKDKAIELLWPVVCFVVLGSTLVHGLSTVGISIIGHFARKKGERAPLLGQETDGLEAMDHEGGNGESEPEVSGSEID